MSNMLKEIKKCASDFNLPTFYNWLLKNGVGFTPTISFSGELDSTYSRNSIIAKLEYTNFGESIKARPFATMLHRNLISGNVGSKAKVVAATSGNFGLAGSFLLFNKFDFTVCMSKKSVNENKGLTRKLVKNKTKIETFSDRYCPTVDAKRGEAIAAARYMEEIDATTNYDQYDDLGNPLSHYLTTAPEIYHQLSNKISYFVASLGTCGTMLGCGYYLKEINPKTKLIGLIPQEGHHQLGLRSKEELGATRFYEEVEKLCDKIIEVSDADAYNSMLKLWDSNIPAGISGGVNYFGALTIAKELKDEERNKLIATLLPDSCENYKDFLERHLYDVTGIKFKGDVYRKFKNLRIRAEEERRKHLSLSNNGRTELFEIISKHMNNKKNNGKGTGI